MFSKVICFPAGILISNAHGSNNPKLETTCTFNFRWNTKKMDELQRICERERELNILRNIQLNRQNGEGGKY